MSTIRAGRPSQNRNAQLAYEALEPRCVLTGPHQIFVPLPDNVNLVQNESFSTQNENMSALYPAEQVPGWDAISGTGESAALIGVIPFPGQGSVLNLDSSSSQNQVYQDIPTQPGKPYLLSFDFRTHPFVHQHGFPQESTRFAVYWNGSLVATVQPRLNWKTISLQVFGGAEPNSRLVFTEMAEGNHDQVGALINRVRVVQVTEGVVRNGQFEQFKNNSHTFPSVYHPNAIPGWMTPSSKGPAVLRLENVRPHIKTVLGSKGLNLNANQGVRDSVFQNLATEPEALYYVKFHAQANGTEQLRVRWNDTLALTVHPDSRWEEIGLLVKATGKMTNLTFIEGAASSGNLWIDNVRIFRVDTPAYPSRPPYFRTATDPVIDYSALSYFVDDQTTQRRRLALAASN